MRCPIKKYHIPKFKKETAAIKKVYIMEMHFWNDSL
jgi:hypothetical protein